jgi:hypothetical protein
MSLGGLDVPIGHSNTTEFLKDTSFYEGFTKCLPKLKSLKGIESVTFYCDRYVDTMDPYSEVSIDLLIKNRWETGKDTLENDDYLKSLEFNVGKLSISLETDNYILETPKPKPLGSKHPDNGKGGYRTYFSLAKIITVYDKNWIKKGDFHIDERGFNILNANGSHIEFGLKSTIMKEYIDMKASDPAYGTYDSESRDSSKEGKRNLYAHDFLL